MTEERFIREIHRVASEAAEKDGQIQMLKALLVEARKAMDILENWQDSTLRSRIDEALKSLLIE